MVRVYHGDSLAGDDDGLLAQYLLALVGAGDVGVDSHDTTLVDVEGHAVHAGPQLDGKELLLESSNGLGAQHNIVSKQEAREEHVNVGVLGETGEAAVDRVVLEEASAEVEEVVDEDVEHEGRRGAALADTARRCEWLAIVAIGEVAHRGLRRSIESLEKLQGTTTNTKTLKLVQQNRMRDHVKSLLEIKKTHIRGHVVDATALACLQQCGNLTHTFFTWAKAGLE